jgi:hypothetical protein
METQIGQIASHLREREKGKLPSQSVPNPKLQFHEGSSSNAVHAVVTLRSGKQVDNQVVHPKENPAAQEGQGSMSVEKRDVEPSTLAPTIETPPGLLYLRRLTLTDFSSPRKKESSRTFWRYSNKCRSTSRSWMPSSKCRLTPSS